jgi:hypothetical protein
MKAKYILLKLKKMDEFNFHAYAIRIDKEL